MTKQNSSKLILLSGILSTSLYAETTLCYKENVSSISQIQTLKLDGAYCDGKKTIADMKTDLWEVSDIKTTMTNDKYNFVYIFKKDTITEDMIENKINKVLLSKEIVKKEDKPLTKKEKLSLGKNIYTKDCSSCHGVEANQRIFNSDKLTNLPEYTFFQKMNEYRFGTDSSLNASRMNEASKFLENTDIENIYEYIQTLKKN
ncbi:c-type cytochrome [Poseidonibacter ostreae]|uniref:c-type cytochrome n=1 Tax=Poseidonibacter ostreae TaxID=2654171 RepID=UPI0012657EB3|nr:c-type cytochrome [Poseidonibacter ostreae]KAB7887925.1 c-type cytochrome [Poseidonibacter ostreae]